MRPFEVKKQPGDFSPDLYFYFNNAELAPLSDTAALLVGRCTLSIAAAMALAKLSGLLGQIIEQAATL